MKHFIPVATLAAVAALTLTACDTATDPVAAPSSSAAHVDSEAFREQSREAMRRLEHDASLGIPGPVISQLAEVAAEDGSPLAFSWGGGSCAWVRTPDGALWSLQSGGPLTRDDQQLEWFRANPGAMVAKECEQTAESLPTRPDPAITAPYRWRDGATTKVSIAGIAYELPSPISQRGAVLLPEASAGPTTPTN
ncbi:hypothetical protein [Mycobacteroides abscessus]|uniref:hypothetical protein n=1 Tax=Mycobacteroides abscessus TaxID=36809 RepID=UPI000E680390|nr:hypothetical protein [Mycobacteroides abscessus]RIS51918.1 hypothetical protein D2E46_23945 [Mycobacteroides abscessus]